MRKSLVSSVVTALAVGAVGGFSLAATAPAARAATEQTLSFGVVFSPFTAVATNNERDPNFPIAIGDEIVFHDQLFVRGQRVGDDDGSCVIVSPAPDLLGNCVAVFRLPRGTITTQFASEPGPAPKAMAITGGTGAYRDAGGQGTLVEFGDGNGSLTFKVLTFG